MSGATKPEPRQDADPSMEDILASIRRILSEDEAAPAPADDVLVLEPSMMRTDLPAGEAPEPHPATPALTPEPLAHVASQPLPLEDAPLADPTSGLVSPEIAAAAASSVAGLLRTLASDRALQVRTAGPTIEDLVRQMLRPLLKEWLDANLPDLVERHVRAEIERVVGRAVG